MPGKLRQEAHDISVGSAVRLLAELDDWIELCASFTNLPQWVVNNVENLAEVSRAALRIGLAVEIA
jgi:hypothetical protein